MRPSEDSTGGLWQLLATELAPYPGRISVVVRMAVSCTLVVAITMVFRIPGAALGAYFPLLMPRASLASTWRTVRVTAVLCVLGTVELLLGAMLFAGSPMAHFFWAMGSLFLVFYLVSAMRAGNAAVGFGLLLAGGISVWDNPLSANDRVTLTLFALLSILIGCASTIAVEIVFDRFHPDDLVLNGVRERLAVVRELFETYIGETQPKPLLRHRLLQLARHGAGHLLETLSRLHYEEPYRSQIGTALSLSGELVELGSNLAELVQYPSEGDRQHMRAIAQRLAQADEHFAHGEVPERVDLPDVFESSRTMPSLGAIERNVDLILDAFTEGSSGVLLPHAAQVKSGLFADDAFRGNRHLLFAVRGTLAAMLCYLAYLSVGWKTLNASVVTCFLTALSNIGLTRQRQLLRLLGVFAGGCLLGFGSQIFLLPWIDTIPQFAAVFGINMLLCAWVATSGPRLAYAGVQMGLAYDLVNLNGFAMNTSLLSARDAVLGILLGLGAMWLIYDHLGATSSRTAIRSLFLANLRSLVSAGTALQRSAEASEIRGYRERIDRAFEDLRLYADSTIFEVHATRDSELAAIDCIRRLQPEMRALSLLQFALLQHITVSGIRSELTGRALLKTSEMLESMAVRLEGEQWPSEPEILSELTNAIEQTHSRCAAADVAPGLDMRLSHSLLVVARDVWQRFEKDLNPADRVVRPRLVETADSRGD